MPESSPLAVIFVDLKASARWNGLERSVCVCACFLVPLSESTRLLGVQKSRLMTAWAKHWATATSWKSGPAPFDMSLRNGCQTNPVFEAQHLQALPLVMIENFIQLDK